MNAMEKPKFKVVKTDTGDDLVRVRFNEKTQEHEVHINIEQYYTALKKRSDLSQVLALALDEEVEKHIIAHAMGEDLADNLVAGGVQ